MKILITGCAGFIGMHLCQKLLGENDVFGIDNLNHYYDPKLKKLRLHILKKNKNFKFFKININNKKKLKLILKKIKPKLIIHLASEVGVRNSITRPRSYINTNILGFLNILECSKELQIKKIFYASSSSVYGNNNKKNLIENKSTDKPISIYAASKKSAEILASAYSHLYKIEIVGLRFFTVYGPYGRPDMAIYKFTDAIYKKEKIQVYDKGKLERDFTYIDDITFHIKNIIKKKFAGHQIFNIGNTYPITVKKVIALLEKNIGLKANINFTKMPKTEVYKTHANITKLKKISNLKKKTPINLGIYRFVKWFKSYKKK